MSLEFPTTPALKYFLLFQNSLLCGAAVSILEEWACSKQSFLQLPLWWVLSFHLPPTVMYLSVQDYKTQIENTVTQKWTLKAEFLKYILSVTTCHIPCMQHFFISQNGEQDDSSPDKRNRCCWIMWFIFFTFQFKNRPERKYSNFSIFSS